MLVLSIQILLQLVDYVDWLIVYSKAALYVYVDVAEPPADSDTGRSPKCMRLQCAAKK